MSRSPTFTRDGYLAQAPKAPQPCAISLMSTPSAGSQEVAHRRMPLVVLGDTIAEVPQNGGIVGVAADFGRLHDAVIGEGRRNSSWCR